MFIPPYQGDKMLVAIFAGITEGAGLALIFIRGGTTGERIQQQDYWEGVFRIFQWVG